MKNVQKIAVVGSGVIGSSWAAFYLFNGFEVSVYDPAVDAEINLYERVKVYLLDLVALHHQENNQTNHQVEAELLNRPNDQIEKIMANLSFFDQLIDAIKDVDFIQENGPERLELKQELYRQMTQHCPSDTIIASSSSGLKISDIQSQCIHPERVILGHPFNPPHLLPLVEIVGGSLTSEACIQDTFDFYSVIGKKPIVIHKEVKGHVANRLQAAIWREAFSLVSNGVCSAEDVDVAITNGPGLRWSIFGPYVNMQLANMNGFKAAMHHLGEPMTEWWADMKAFDLTEDGIAQLDEETQKFLTKLEGQDLRLLRDTALIDILKMKKSHNLL